MVGGDGGEDEGRRAKPEGRGRAVGTEDQTEAEPLGPLVKLRLVLATTPTQGGYVTFRFCLCGFYTTFRFFNFFNIDLSAAAVFAMD